MPVDFAWSLDVLVRDLELAITKLGTGPVHLVGAKVAGPVVMRFAATRPHLARSVTVAGSLLKGPQQTGEWVDHITQHGVASWAQLTMSPRLGASMPQEAVNWWIELTSKTPQSTMLGLLRAVPQIDVSGDLQNIRCPTLVIATDSRRRPLQETAAWQKLIPDSELVALAGDAYHVAASQPDECARACVEFLLRRGRP